MENKKRKDSNPDIKTQQPKQQQRMTNAEFARSDAEFGMDCDAAGVKRTKRQASGYRNKRRGETSRGLAYKERLKRLNKTNAAT
jgi:hypothetical protein